MRLTFERNFFLTIRKKHLSLCKEILHISLTFFFTLTLPYRLNGIAIQKPFIGPRQLHERQNIPKSKKRSLDVAPLHLPDYIAGIRPDPPLLLALHVDHIAK